MGGPKFVWRLENVYVYLLGIRWKANFSLCSQLPEDSMFTARLSNFMEGHGVVITNVRIYLLCPEFFNSQ